MATVGRACGGVDGGGATGAGVVVSFSSFIFELSASSSLAASFGFFSAFSAPLPLSAVGGVGGGAVISSGFLAAVATSAWRGVVGAALWRGAGGGSRSRRRSKVGAWLEREKPWMRMRGESGEKIGHPTGE
ncbi:hypothetical protein GUJ93_ZPchr0009g1419 [Zizania palustris]|uniref:Uncharacterized protein n=1 Tax=Zizania palustris TaxID=103762 RepID=A0A8J5RR25_ZIZPA|nr:hypothetical protein GUJ93_ZPchr0009g1419 [Zizania palustris]